MTTKRLSPRLTSEWKKDVQPYALPDVVEVAWHDSFASHGWDGLKERLAEDRKAANCRSVGYLIEDTRKNVRIASSTSHNELVGCTITIPKHAIRHLGVLSKKSKR